MNTPLAGLTYLIDGFHLIFKPALRRYVFIPLMINIVLFILLFFLAGHFFKEFNQWFVTYLPAWLHWLSAILWLVFFASFFLIMLYTFVIFANLVSAPFNSFLAEKTELHLTGSIPEPRSLWENITDIPRILGRQFSILGYYLPRALLIFVLLFIPVLQIFAALIWFLFHAWFMALTYLDYPTDNHRVPISKLREWLNENRWLALSFGMSILIVTMVPFLNLLVIPAAVAAATKLWINENRINA